MPPVTKRVRENTDTDLKSAQKADSLSPSLLQLLDKRLKEQTDLIATKMEECENRLCDLLAEKIGTLTGQIKQLSDRVEFLEKELGEARGITQRVADLEAKLSHKLSVQENANIACDLRIHGVPFVEGEKLKHIFNTLCFNLNLTPAPTIKDIYRMGKGRNQPQSIVDPVIIVKLDHLRDKAALLRAIGTLRRETQQTLTLQQLGLDSPAPVYVNEQLTKENYLVFREAMKLKKARKLTAVFTRRGVVHVRASQNGEIIVLENMNHLSMIPTCSFRHQEGEQQ
ncbi:uncharacterized protein LOC121404203 [Drosophila obscura]|uniref:uncharacterized protein LOC121404203 n=1 Tax=Drosophila obscura TaxID=7282 RepID=UPI001BB21970|nr:uncharacterized protein LOC121404203 [Drosophila obscura]